MFSSDGKGVKCPKCKAFIKVRKGDSNSCLECGHEVFIYSAIKFFVDRLIFSLMLFMMWKSGMLLLLGVGIQERGKETPLK